jgi:dTDP-4-dehydrorhamnose 3,5-epimerase
MKTQPTEIPDVIVIEPDVHRDPRGFFLESYNARKYREGGIAAPFVQDNHSSSMRGTLRGLHAQRRRPQGKLLRVIEGEIFDVAVDVRRGSPTFGHWVGVRLSAENFKQIYVPPGFAHGFCVLSELAQVEYKVTDFYDPTDELGLLWNDPEIGIRWPLKEPLLSAKDSSAPRLREIMDQLPIYE